MVATYGVLSNYVNRVRHRHGQPPERNSVMRAVIMVLGINIATKAAVVGNVTRPGVDAALTVIQSEDQGLLAAVLVGATNPRRRQGPRRRQADRSLQKRHA